MRVFSWLVVGMAGVLPSLALGQGLPARPAITGATKEAQRAPAPANAAQPESADIVVRARRERQSSWRRAETGHAIVYSNGSEGDLRRVAVNLERLYYLMSRVFGRDDAPDATVKLRVILIGDSDFMRHMRLINTRSAEGPYPTPFDDQRYYDPRDDGAVLAVSRSDLYFDLTPRRDDAMDGEDDPGADLSSASLDDGNLGFDADPTPFPLAFDALGAAANKQRQPPPDPEVRPWESMLYSGFAQHFMLTYYPAAYPRWYLDGIGALFSTVQFRNDGSIEYGRSPDNLRRAMSAFGDLDVGRVLTGGGAAKLARGWSPYHAWLVAHFFFFADLPTDRRVQFVRYMSAVAQGVPLVQAASVFGDLSKLQREVMRYGTGRTYFQTLPFPTDRNVDPQVNRLSVSDAALLKMGLELRGLLDTPTEATSGARAGNATRAERVQAAAIARREKYIADLRATVSKLPYNKAASLLLAEAECRTGDIDGCAAAAGTVLANEPGDSAALAWLGLAEIARAKAASLDTRADAFDSARRTIGRANRSDTEAVLPIIAYFRSFVDAGQAAPDLALLGMLKVIEEVPASPGPRVLLGEELARRGRIDAARKIMMPVLYGGYDSPEQARAARILAKPVAGVAR